MRPLWHIFLQHKVQRKSNFLKTNGGNVSTGMISLKEIKRNLVSGCVQRSGSDITQRHKLTERCPEGCERQQSQPCGYKGYNGKDKAFSQEVRLLIKQVT